MSLMDQRNSQTIWMCYTEHPRLDFIPSSHYHQLTEINADMVELMSSLLVIAIPVIEFLLSVIKFLLSVIEFMLSVNEYVIIKLFFSYYITLCVQFDSSRNLKGSEW